MPATRRRKTTKKVEPCRSRKLKSTTQQPHPTLRIISISTSTNRPHKSYAKWTKFTLSSRLIDPFVTAKPTSNHYTSVETTDLPYSTTTKIPFVKHVFSGSDRLSQPWTHREQKPEIGCPNGEVSPIELALVWVRKSVFD